MRYLLSFLLFITFSNVILAQSITRIPLADSLAMKDSTYRKEVNLSLGGVPLSELLRTVATVSGANINVQTNDQSLVSCHFKGVRVADLLFFLASKYHLQMESVGTILSIHSAPVAEPPKRLPEIVYHVSDSTVSFKIESVSLVEVIKEMGQKTGVNIIVPASLHSKEVSAFVTRLSLDDAINALAAANGLSGEKQKGVWYLSLSETTKESFTPRSVSSGKNQLTIDTLGRVTAHLVKSDVGDIIREVCQRLSFNYFFISPIRQETSIDVKDIAPNEFFTTLLIGTNFSYYLVGNVFVFGTIDLKENNFTSASVFRMEHRSADKVIDLVPANLKKNVQLQLFPDQNSIVISGEQKAVGRVEHFLREIDKSVPMISIEVMILDVTKSRLSEIGITAGKSDKPVSGSGTLSGGGLDITWGAAGLNRIINGFNSFSGINLGRVSESFYVNLKLLEENGVVELRSTPRLATLNGHETTLKSGETKYYKEVQNNIIGSQNPMQSESYSWKSVEANLDVKITPYVSLDYQITLDISIEQSEFMAREEKDAPPGIATRKFKSLVRARSEDMILLGGIERNNQERRAGGVPFLSRIPIIKWFFGSTKNNKTTQKLSIFIKPTVSYVIDGCEVAVCRSPEEVVREIELVQQQKRATPYTFQELRVQRKQAEQQLRKDSNERKAVLKAEQKARKRELHDEKIEVPEKAETEETMINK